MLQNHLKMAYRTLRKHPAYAFINVAGLAVGMACFIRKTFRFESDGNPLF